MLNIGIETVNNEWDYQQVISPFFRFYIILDGEAELEVEGKIVHLQPGMFYLVKAFSFANYRCENYMSHLYIHFSEFKEKSSLSILHQYEFFDQIIGDNLINEACKRLLSLFPNRELENPNPKHKHYNSERFSLISSSKELESSALLNYLLMRFIKRKKNFQKESGHYIGKALEYIHFNYMSGILVKDLADICQLHPDYFSRIFQEIIGKRPLQYIIQYKVVKAQELLINSQKTIEEVGFDCGFPTRSLFYKQFEKSAGINPGAFRKKYQS